VRNSLRVDAEAATRIVGPEMPVTPLPPMSPAPYGSGEAHRSNCACNAGIAHFSSPTNDSRVPCGTGVADGSNRASTSTAEVLSDVLDRRIALGMAAMTI
jgi:hypothetical protein